MFGFQTFDDGEGIGEAHFSPLQYHKIKLYLKTNWVFYIYIFPFKAHYLHTKQSLHKIIQRPIINMT